MGVPLFEGSVGYGVQTENDKKRRFVVDVAQVLASVAATHMEGPSARLMPLFQSPRFRIEGNNIVLMRALDCKRIFNKVSKSAILKNGFT